MMKHIVLPDIGERDLVFYLAMEEFVAEKFQDESFFVWQSGPTVIIGRNQDLEAEVNLGYCREHGVRVYRRKSGGGCVYSDKGNIMISYISRRGDVSSVFDRYLSELTSCLNALGLEAERSGRNDILVAGKKVSGNAFHMLPDRSIVHGTLLYSTDLDALEAAVNPPLEKLSRHGVASVRQRVRNLADYVSETGLVHEAFESVGTLEEHIVRSFCDGEIVLTEGDVKEIEAIERGYDELITNNSSYV